LDKPSPTQRRPSPAKFLRPWLPELLASVISIAALLALVFVLRAYQGRGINDLRLPKYLTINGLVALIATVNRTTLLGPVQATVSQEKWLWFSKVRRRSRLVDFETSDAASRSVWGSLLFLIRGRGRLVSYVGALVTIVSLVFGIFAQQLLSIESFPIAGSDTNENLVTPIPRQNTWEDFASGGEVPLSMRAAIYNGMMTNGTISPPQTTCSSGNCTWPVTPSLAICGECQEAAYQKTCDNYNCTFDFEGTGMTLNLSNIVKQGVGTCWTSAAFTEAGILGNRFIISDFIVLGLPYAAFTQQGWYGLTSHRCSLSWCINAYSRTSISGKQTERIVATHSTWQQLSTDDTPEANITSLPPSFNPTPGEVYSLSSHYAYTIGYMLQVLLNGTGGCGIDSGADETRSSDAADAIWYYTSRDPNAWINNLAMSMSNIVRTTVANVDEGESETPPSPGDPIFDQYHGTAYQLGIQVRWAWITLPVAAVVVSLAMLIYEMISTARSGVYPWKSSPLTLLLAELEPSLRQQVYLDDMTEHGGLSRKIGRQRAVLEWDTTGKLRVTGVDLG
jgi:hypothetical protein